MNVDMVSGYCSTSCSSRGNLCFASPLPLAIADNKDTITAVGKLDTELGTLDFDTPVKSKSAHSISEHQTGTVQ